MPDKYVLDSSIIAAVFFQEKSSSKAEQIVSSSELITLDLAMAEVSNVAWKRIKIFQDDPEIIYEALKNSVEFIKTACQVIRTEELIEDSFSIALNKNVTIYDALFLAASQKINVPLLTLDKRLAKTSQEVELL
ncbi:type II toxin-antitoxin system VapC family toxin [Methanobacterium alkalithermotolerans]|uniref:Type II toxin-antitoxin system VapC family toxin n=1 Tax=Methanobacterium alkalithermotolerans TaxID=2731220 RepID=A0A8T8K539_9EURY|nr:type II toxin-antitoxin system VapC family toxin [Methanobacterium alkalithermotolerans]QUH22605.1 type II toxin-antitoxin system VapC family toxin [Methanobacterium alkalithermotolerans]